VQCAKPTSVYVHCCCCCFRWLQATQPTQAELCATSSCSQSHPPTAFPIAAGHTANNRPVVCAMRLLHKANRCSHAMLLWLLFSLAAGHTANNRLGVCALPLLRKANRCSHAMLLWLLFSLAAGHTANNRLYVCAMDHHQQSELQPTVAVASLTNMLLFLFVLQDIQPTTGWAYVRCVQRLCRSPGSATPTALA
jgi:hypothetical protein